MLCEIKLKIHGGKEISLKMEMDPSSDPSFLSDEELLKFVLELNKSEDPNKNSPYIEFMDEVHDKLYSTINISKQNIKKVLKTKGLVPNLNLNNIREMFPKIPFPSSVGNEDIFMAHNIRMGTISMNDSIVYNGNKRMFVTDGSEESLTRIAGFLRLELTILDKICLFDENSDEYKIMTELRESINSEKKDNSLKSNEDLLLDFIYNQKEYRQRDLPNGDSAYLFLNKITRSILEYSTLDNYDDKFVLIVNNKKKFYKKTYRLVIDDLIEDMIKYKSDVLLSLNLANKKSLSEFLSDKEKATKLIQQKNPLVTDGHKWLFQQLFSKESAFNLELDSIGNYYAVFKTIPVTVFSKYDLDYNIIKAFNRVGIDGDTNKPYRGYTIYEQNNKDGTKWYYYSLGTLSEETITTRFKSKQDLKAFLDNKIDSQPVYKNSFIEFKFRSKTTNKEGITTYDNSLHKGTIKSYGYIPKRTIISFLDVPVDSKTLIALNETGFIYKSEKYTVQDFFNLVDTYGFDDLTKTDIKKSINNSEKIETFIYKINEILGSDRTNNAAVAEIVKMIDEAPTKDYYIESTEYDYNSSKYKYRIIPTEFIDYEEYSNQDVRIPTIRLMEAVAKNIKLKIGLSINLMSSELLFQRFKDDEIDVSAKAFIRNNDIYINTSVASSDDLVHEYTHILLGVLKSNPQLLLNYEELMSIFSQTKEGQSEMLRLRSAYSNLSQVDLMEEAFCNLFSLYVMSNIDPENIELFKQYKHKLKEGADVLFDKPIDDLDLIMGKSMGFIFNRFSKGVSMLLEHGNLNYGEIRKSRLISNKLSLMLGNEITENCV